MEPMYRALPVFASVLVVSLSSGCGGSGLLTASSEEPVEDVAGGETPGPLQEVQPGSDDTAAQDTGGHAPPSEDDEPVQSSGDDGSRGAEASEPDSVPAPEPPELTPPPPTEEVGPDTTVDAFRDTHLYFSGWDEDQNRRTVQVQTSFPPAHLLYESVTLNMTLRCPEGGCDFWDRIGYLSVSEPDAGGGQSQVEILRFATPYRVGAQWSVDVTDLRPVLSGNATLRLFIDTWVGPGHDQGAGWLVDVTIAFVGGLPARRAVAVIPIWETQTAVYGDPARPVTESLGERTHGLVPGAAHYELRAIVTGHGQGNADNCAEFCTRDHTVWNGHTAYSARIWRDDCATTAAPNQRGTWRYARAGWCPGAAVHPWRVTLEEVSTTNGVALTYDVEDYENTCRPDASVCRGCSLLGSCDYNGGSHTEPHYLISVSLIAFQ